MIAQVGYVAGVLARSVYTAKSGVIRAIDNDPVKTTDLPSPIKTVKL